MLSWTDAGAVQRPETLQIRVQRRYPGRVRASAPTPGRSLSLEEVLDNLRYFTEGQRGPRTAPCTGLVLSGVGLLSSQDTGPSLVAARELGIRHTVVHAGVEDLATLEATRWRGLVDTLVVPLRPSDAGPQAPLESARIAACRAAGIALAVNCVLDATAVAVLPALVDAARRWEPASFTLSFPFPGAADPADLVAPAVLLPALRAAVASLQGQACSPRLKGLPACHLAELAPLLAPSSNRWYVDAEHQRERALLFFPDVLAFHKGEACRFCARDPSCDGFFVEWLRLAGFPPLEPLSAP
ncbi:MAG: hypothetical protein ABIO70_12410 [Pseudomonadota bacterium]